MKEATTTDHYNAKSNELSHKNMNISRYIQDASGFGIDAAVISTADPHLKALKVDRDKKTIASTDSEPPAKTRSEYSEG